MITRPVNPALRTAPQPVTRTQLRTRATDDAISLIHTYHAALTDEPHIMAIPVLPDDTVAYVLDRLSEATGPVVLVLPQAGGSSRIVTLVDRSELAGGAA
jgi:hypothetical protein